MPSLTVLSGQAVNEPTEDRQLDEASRRTVDRQRLRLNRNASTNCTASSVPTTTASTATVPTATARISKNDSSLSMSTNGTSAEQKLTSSLSPTTTLCSHVERESTHCHDAEPGTKADFSLGPVVQQQPLSHHKHNSHLLKNLQKIVPSTYKLNLDSADVNSASDGSAISDLRKELGVEAADAGVFENDGEVGTADGSLETIIVEENRSKRITVPVRWDINNYDDQTGMTRQETIELKKALSASLLETHPVNGTGGSHSTLARECSRVPAAGDASRGIPARNTIGCKTVVQRKFIGENAKTILPSRKILAGQKAKTEDFLNFLCLRAPISPQYPTQSDFLRCQMRRESESSVVRQRDSSLSSADTEISIESASPTSLLKLSSESDISRAISDQCFESDGKKSDESLFDRLFVETAGASQSLSSEPRLESMSRVNELQVKTPVCPASEEATEEQSFTAGTPSLVDVAEMCMETSSSPMLSSSRGVGTNRFEKQNNIMSTQCGEAADPIVLENQVQKNDQTESRAGETCDQTASDPTSDDSRGDCGEKCHVASVSITSFEQMKSFESVVSIADEAELCCNFGVEKFDLNSTRLMPADESVKSADQKEKSGFALVDSKCGVFDEDEIPCFVINVPKISYTRTQKQNSGNICVNSNSASFDSALVSSVAPSGDLRENENNNEVPVPVSENDAQISSLSSNPKTTNTQGLPSMSKTFQLKNVCAAVPWVSKPVNDFAVCFERFCLSTGKQEPSEGAVSDKVSIDAGVVDVVLAKRMPVKYRDKLKRSEAMKIDENLVTLESPSVSYDSLVNLVVATSCSEVVSLADGAVIVTSSETVIADPQNERTHRSSCANKASTRSVTAMNESSLNLTHSVCVPTSVPPIVAFASKSINHGTSMTSEASLVNATNNEAMSHAANTKSVSCHPASVTTAMQEKIKNRPLESLASNVLAKNVTSPTVVAMGCKSPISISRLTVRNAAGSTPDSSQAVTYYAVYGPAGSMVSDTDLNNDATIAVRLSSASRGHMNDGVHALVPISIGGEVNLGANSGFADKSFKGGGLASGASTDALSSQVDDQIACSSADESLVEVGHHSSSEATVSISPSPPQASKVSKPKAAKLAKRRASEVLVDPDFVPCTTGNANVEVGNREERVSSLRSRSKLRGSVTELTKNFTSICSPITRSETSSNDLSSQMTERIQPLSALSPGTTTQLDHSKTINLLVQIDSLDQISSLKNSETNKSMSVSSNSPCASSSLDLAEHSLPSNSTLSPQDSAKAFSPPNVLISHSLSKVPDGSKRIASKLASALEKSVDVHLDIVSAPELDVGVSKHECFASNKHNSLQKDNSGNEAAGTMQPEQSVADKALVSSRPVIDSVSRIRCLVPLDISRSLPIASNSFSATVLSETRKKKFEKTVDCSLNVSAEATLSPTAEPRNTASFVTDTNQQSAGTSAMNGVSVQSAISDIKLALKSITCNNTEVVAGIGAQPPSSKENRDDQHVINSSSISTDAHNAMRADLVTENQSVDTPPSYLSWTNRLAFYSQPFSLRMPDSTGIPPANAPSLGSAFASSSLPGRVTSGCNSPQTDQQCSSASNSEMLQETTLSASVPFSAVEVRDFSLVDEVNGLCRNVPACNVDACNEISSGTWNTPLVNVRLGLAAYPEMNFARNAAIVQPAVCDQNGSYAAMEQGLSASNVAPDHSCNVTAVNCQSTSTLVPDHSRSIINAASDQAHNRSIVVSNNNQNTSNEARNDSSDVRDVFCNIQSILQKRDKTKTSDRKVVANTPGSVSASLPLNGASNGTTTLCKQPVNLGETAHKSESLPHASLGGLNQNGHCQSVVSDNKGVVVSRKRSLVITDSDQSRSSASLLREEIKYSRLETVAKSKEDALPKAPFSLGVDCKAAVLYQPPESGFKDPLCFMAAIQHTSEPHGICRIAPPTSFKMHAQNWNDLRFLVESLSVQHMPQSGQVQTRPQQQGKSMTLEEYKNSSLKMQTSRFGSLTNTADLEAEYWRLSGTNDECVGRSLCPVNAKTCGSLFPTRADDPASRHGWNFNNVQHNERNLLKHAGRSSGVVLPSLSVAALFSALPWSRDKHSLPSIHFLHPGAADLVWYCVPACDAAKLHAAIKRLSGGHLDLDSEPPPRVMISPEALIGQGVVVTRTVQCSGEFVVVFPGAYTASVACGFGVVESVRYATPNWIPLGLSAVKSLEERGTMSSFSVSKLIIATMLAPNTANDVHRAITPHLAQIVEAELSERKRLTDLGVSHSTEGHDENALCDHCHNVCFLSMVVSDEQNTIYCLRDALSKLSRRALKSYELVYNYSQKYLLELLASVQGPSSVDAKKRKTSHN